jgi:hypothetical protein
LLLQPDGGFFPASRPAIANEAWHATVEPITLARFEDLAAPPYLLWNFKDSEWVFGYTAALLNTPVIRTDFDAAGNDVSGGNALGAIQLGWKSTAAGNNNVLDLLSFTRAGVRLRKRHFRFRVTVTLRWVSSIASPTKRISLFLCETMELGATGVYLSPAQQVDLAHGVTTRVQIFFESPLDLRDEPADAFLDNTEGVLLGMGLGETHFNASEDEEDLFIYRARVELMAGDVHHGKLLNEGPVYANSFNFGSGAMDWKTYGPGDAGPYGESGYGDGAAWDLEGIYGDTTPPSDGRVNPGSQPMIYGSALLDVGPNAEWTGDELFTDTSSPSNYWFRGMHDAAFHFLERRYFPGVQTTEPVGGVTVRDRSFSEMVGHIIRLDPPHGSYLRSLSLVVSISPAFLLSTPTRVGGVPPTWGVYSDAECGPQDVAIPKTEGYVIQLVRHSALPIEYGVRRQQGADPVLNWVAGFGEILHEWEVDLQAPDAKHHTIHHLGSSTAKQERCDEGEGFQYTLDEWFIISKISLAEQLSHYEGIVDRRQFSYSLVVKCWGEGNANSEAVIKMVDDYLPPADPNAHTSIRMGMNSNGISFATKFKFRSATLGCLATRVNP